MVFKPRTLGNPTSNAIFEWINLVIGNLLWTYNIKDTNIDKYEPWLCILAAVSFIIFPQQIY